MINDVHKSANITPTPEDGASSIPSANLNESKFSNYYQHLGKIIKLQTFFRGYIIRKAYSRSLFSNLKNTHIEKKPNNEVSNKTENIKESNHNGGETNYVENRQFPNGAIYTGQSITRPN